MESIIKGGTNQSLSQGKDPNSYVKHVPEGYMRDGLTERHVGGGSKCPVGTLGL
jgi:hypothetical protein